MGIKGLLFNMQLGKAFYNAQSALDTWGHTPPWYAAELEKEEVCVKFLKRLRGRS